MSYWKFIKGLSIATTYFVMALKVDSFNFPPPQLPNFHPVKKIIIDEYNPFEHDCWGVEPSYCWYDEYYI